MSLDEGKKIRASLILEILGRPPEHLVKTLEDLINKINEEKGVKVENKKIHETKLVKDQKDLYTTYAEIEIEVENIMQLLGLIFRYMPAHIEIVSPENITLQNNNLNEVVNEIARRLHQYDEVARVLQNEKIILERKLREVLEKKKNDK